MQSPAFALIPSPGLVMMGYIYFLFFPGLKVKSAASRCDLLQLLERENWRALSSLSHSPIHLKLFMCKGEHLILWV